MINTKPNSDAAATAANVHRNAYNAAFYELGLKWHWDGNIYQSLLPNSDEKERIRSYLETYQPHLLKSYDADFLTNVIQTTKARCFDAMTAEGCRVGADTNWAEIAQAEVGF